MVVNDSQRLKISQKRKQKSLRMSKNNRWSKLGGMWGLNGTQVGQNWTPNLVKHVKTIKNL